MASQAGKSFLSVISIVFRVSIGGIAVILSVAIAGYLFNSKAEPEKKPRTEPGLLVRTVSVEPVELARIWEGYGTVRAMQAADVNAQVAGAVVERPEGVEAGRSIEEGALIVRLDPEEYQAQVSAQAAQVEATRAQIERLDVEEANAREQYDLVQQELELSRGEYERAAAAFERGAGNRNEVEDRLAEIRRIERTAAVVRQNFDLIPTRRAELEARLANQQAALQLAEIDLARTQIRAPFAGILQEVDVREGERVSPGDRVARVVDLSRVEIPIRLPASAGDGVKPGDEVEVVTDAPEPYRWTGAVAGLAPEADPSTRSITALVEVEQDPETTASLLRPGRFVIARVRSGDPAPRLVVPRSAVMEDRVVVARSAEDRQVADFVPVRVAFFFDGPLDRIDPLETQWAVLDRERSALEEGDTLVVSNLDEIRAGTRVLVDGAAIARDGDEEGSVTASSREGGS